MTTLTTSVAPGTISTMKKLPGVLAFQRSHLVSDAEMFSLFPDGQREAVQVVRHGVLGTQNVNDGKGNAEHVKTNKGETDSERGISNPQITESAHLDSRATALVVQFDLCMLDIDNALHSCTAANKTEGRNMRASIVDFIERSKKSEGLYNVALRYTRNIANGRWLWRNRAIARQLEITVTRNGQDQKTELARFDALSIPLNRFDQPNEQEHAVAKELAEQMRGNSLGSLTITATLTPRVGGSIEVYPSQNYAKTPTGFSRPLYKLGQPDPYIKEGAQDPFQVQDTRRMGAAAIRDQKIFNAIRTIDTWYPTFSELGIPLAVEPLGASLAMQEFYRSGKHSSFEKFKILINIEPDSDDGMYCIAALDRGGVYGESDKKDQALKSKEVTKPEGIDNKQEES